MNIIKTVGYDVDEKLVLFDEAGNVLDRLAYIEDETTRDSYYFTVLMTNDLELADRVEGTAEFFASEAAQEIYEGFVGEYNRTKNGVY